MKPTKRSQPYRKSNRNRPVGPALGAMKRGRGAFGPNPQDVNRALTKQARRRRRFVQALSKR